MNRCGRYVEVIYCDDIRQEVGNKMSYMGVYSADLFVSAVPITLPKICIAAKVVTDVTDLFKELEVRVVKDDDDVELISTGRITQFPPLGNIDEKCTRVFLQMNFVMAPFQIEEDTIIRVVAKTEREELRGMGLRLRIQASEAGSADKK